MGDKNIKEKSKRRSRIPYEQNHKIIDSVEHKKCSICEEWFPMDTDNFYKNKANRVDGFNPYCKPCTSKKSRKWELENKHKFYEDKKEYARQYALREDRRELRRQAMRSFTERGKRKEWTSSNKDKMRKYSLKRKNKNHDISKSEWDSCKEYFNNSCAYCGLTFEEHKKEFNQDLHKEHVEHEGSNDISNCVPACKTCNSIKNIKKFQDWYNEENPVYMLERFNKINKWLTNDYKQYKEN
jgi:hypothetical protein